MRPVTIRLSAAGFSDWVQLNRLQADFKVGLNVKLSTGATLTYTVQHTFDDLHETSQAFSIARVTTTATVTKVAHGLSVGDWILVENGEAPFDGEYSVATVVDVDTFTYTVVNSGATALAAGVGYIRTARVISHAALVAQTASADGNYEFPCQATRLNVSAYTDGTADFTVLQGHV